MSGWFQSEGGPHANATYWLVGLEGKCARIRARLVAPVLVGRGPYNHVVIDDASASWQHARIVVQEEGPVVYDLNSTNGTRVNGSVVLTRHALRPNDLVRFGSCSFLIECSYGDEPQRQAPSPLVTERRSFDAPGEAPFAPKPIFEVLGADGPQLVPGEPRAADLGQLEDAYQKLRTLYDFMQAISTSIDRRELLALIGRKIRDVYPSSSAVGIYLRDTGTPSATELRLAFGAGLQAAVAPVLPDDVRDAVIAARRSVAFRSAGAGGGTSMYAPMVHLGEVLGMVQVASKGPAFSRADLDLLHGMASPATLMLQNAFMHQDSLARERLAYDLELAARIQDSFLPREVIRVEGYELVADYRAAYTVGGDFYDVFWVGPERLGLFVGDIAGKGVAAALLMARISSELRATALAHVEPGTVLTAMNSAILARDQPDLFFTVVYLTLDVRTGEVVLANAGHPPPYLLRRDGSVHAITEGASSAVGILEDPAFRATAIALGDGDSLLLCTDGVIEAADGNGELYGTERLESCLRSTGPHPEALAKRLLRSVEEFAAGGTENDDLTLFICHRRAGQQASLQPKARNRSVDRPPR